MYDSKQQQNDQSIIKKTEVAQQDHHNNVQCKTSPYRELIYTPKQSFKNNQIENQSTINLHSINHDIYHNINMLLFKQSKTNVNQSIGENDSPIPTMSYKQLQQKIESVLKKNNISKTFVNSPLNKSNFTIQTFNQFNQTLLNRFDLYQQNKVNEIQQKQLQNQVKKSQDLKFHPKINPKSIKIVQQMGGHQPIEQRYQKLLHEKNQRIQLYEQFKKRKDQQEYQHFLQQFEKYQKTSHKTTRSPEQFYEQMLKWKEDSVKNLEQKKKIIQQKQIQQNNYFKPKINKKSKNILLTSSNNELRIPIYERQVPAQKKFKIKIDQECTFKPKINKRRVK